MDGGNTAGFSGGMGLSKLGGMRVRGTCGMLRSFYN